MPNWRDVLTEISSVRLQATNELNAAADIIRHNYLKQLHTKTGRNVIAYYSGWLSKASGLPTEINDEDKNGFMMAVHKLDKKLPLDLILHTPGGSFSATQSIVDYLHKMFPQGIRAVVPQIAMSAGTMIACSCRSILMSEHSNLGPIDPHLRGIPAYGAIKEFVTAFREIAKNPNRVHVWAPILGQYRPTFLGQCRNAISLSKTFVQEQLTTTMFSGTPKAGAAKKAAKIVNALSSYTMNKSHDRHIHMDECKKLGLTIERLEDDPDLQDLVLTVHHCYMNALMNGPSFKIIENHNGVAFVKQQVQIAVRQ